MPASSKMRSRETSAATAGSPSAPTSTRVTGTLQESSSGPDEIGFGAFGVERGEEVDGRHRVEPESALGSWPLRGALKYSPTLSMRTFFLLVTIALTDADQRSRSPSRTSCGCFIRSGPKSHGPGAHDHPRFFKDWVPLLNARGARATGADAFPDQGPARRHRRADPALAGSRQHPGSRRSGRTSRSSSPAAAGWSRFTPARSRAIPTGSAPSPAARGATARRRWLEGPMHLYFTDRDEPITKDMSNWSMDDEIYYDMDMMPDVRVLAAAYTPKAAGGAQRRRAAPRRRADRRRQARQRLRHPAADLDLRTHHRRRTGAVPKLRLDSRSSLRELQPA